MARKVFLSFLGTNNYGKCIYYKDNYESKEVRFIQEATLEYLCKQSEWTNNDKVYILLTDNAKKMNWVDDGHRDRNTHEIIRQEGLKSRLDKMGIPKPCETIEGIPDGNNEDEIWGIFKRAYDVLREGDELYIDLTHGYRYLPMLMLTLGEYAKFLKNTTVKSITYGNFEGRVNNRALIVDLLPLSHLQDWSYAAGQYFLSGDSSKLNELRNTHMSSMMQNKSTRTEEEKNLCSFMDNFHNYVQNMRNCRGINIIKANEVKEMKRLAGQLEGGTLVPLTPIVNKLVDSMGEFNQESDVRNGLQAAKWCFQNKLYQQSITILQETWVSAMCQATGLKWDGWNEDRKCMNTALASMNREDENVIFPYQNNDPEDKKKRIEEKVLALRRNEILKENYKSYNSMTDLRNDLNHAGMRQNAMAQKNLEKEERKLVEKIGEKISMTEELFNKLF